MRGKKYDRGDGFWQISGSRCWPSDDPEDSPEDEFICKLCGYSFRHTMWGSGWVGEPTPGEQVAKRIKNHMLYHIAENTKGKVCNTPDEHNWVYYGNHHWVCNICGGHMWISS